MIPAAADLTGRDDGWETSPVGSFEPSAAQSGRRSSDCAGRILGPSADAPRRRRRAATIVERLGERGVAPERLAALKAPAGLDIAAVTPGEIAVSVLPEIIQHGRSDKTEATTPPSEVAEATDPVCGMTVEIATARYRSDVAGATIYFCCRQCKDTFDRAA